MTLEKQKKAEWTPFCAIYVLRKYEKNVKESGSKYNYLEEIEVARPNKKPSDFFDWLDDEQTSALRVTNKGKSKVGVSKSISLLNTDSKKRSSWVTKLRDKETKASYS